MSDQPLIGRSAELARLRALIDPADQGSDHALVMVGDAGIGKSALLADLAGHASACGLRVLFAAGRERESAFAFAGLQQLLRPVLIELLALPGREAEELRSALGANSSVAGPDRFLAGAALVELLTGLVEPAGGVLVLVDDAQWMDSASLDVLAFAVRRLDTTRITLVLAAHGNVPPTAFQPGLPELRIGPLTRADANGLLDAQPCPPQSRARAQVLAQAEGNPLALIELTRAITADPTAGRRWAALPLPLTDRLSAVLAAPLDGLPAAARHALLLVAVADSADRDAVARAGPGLDPAVLAPAEERGLITVDSAGVRFRHPLIRSAVYHDAPFAIRAAAHQKAAGLLSDQPDRRAWHLGAAALRPDESVASMLAATVSQAQRRSGATAAILALERAADLSPEPADQARRLVAAAEAAAPAGHVEWARDLATRALALTRDRDLRSRARYVTGWAMAWSGRYASAAETLLSLARETAQDDPVTAWKGLGLAATVAYQAGTAEGVRAVADVLVALPSAVDDETNALRLWALTVTARILPATLLLRHLGRTATGEHALSHTGAAAWLLDQTSDAIALLNAARSAPAEAESRAASGFLAPLGWAYLDAGRWDDALELAAEPGSGPGTDITPAAATLITATIEAARGNTSDARTLIVAALAADPEHSRLITARAWHALGLCALADGDYLAAFGHLRRLFGDDGSPYHHHASYLATGDLALAAVRAGCRLDGREMLKRISAVLADTTPWPSLRLRQLLARAYGILADPATPTAYPDDVLSDPAGGQWPFERAQLHLEFGEWLRRHRRINEAKPVLGAALEAFRILRARPWVHRAETELRACGVAIRGARQGGTRLAELTPQQRQIIGLAAQGLSNREIAQRLFLSPRTVASHLYRSFPKLGVAGRHQLHGLLAQANRQER